MTCPTHSCCEELRAALLEVARLTAQVAELQAVVREDADRWQAALPYLRLPGMRQRLTDHIARLRRLG